MICSSREGARNVPRPVSGAGFLTPPGFSSSFFFDIFDVFILDLRHLRCYYNCMTDPRRYTIEELVEMTGVSRRTIRFYIEQGLLPPSAGRGRGGYYGGEHLERLLEIKRQREDGRSIESIRRMLSGETAREEPGIMIEMEYPGFMYVSECQESSAEYAGLFPRPAAAVEKYELAPGVTLFVDSSIGEKEKTLVARLLSAARQRPDRSV